MARTNLLHVVKNGIRKARSIKKFQDSYHVGLAYVGLMELTLGDTSGQSWPTSNSVVRDYRGTLDVDTVAGPVTVQVSMRVSQETLTEGYGRQQANHAFYYDEYDDVEDYISDNMSLWAENMAGTTIVTCNYSIRYDLYDETSGGDKVLFSARDEGYLSVEDCLDAITAKSEEAWGDVTIALNDYADMLQEYNSQKVAFPDTISLSIPNGDTFTVSMKENGNWWGEKTLFDSDNKIQCELKAIFHAVYLKDDGRYSDAYSDGGYYSSYSYNTPRDVPVEYYGVRVIGTIKDWNTQTSSFIKDPYVHDGWTRDFSGEGAETLEGAIAIAESNIAEVYREYLDYIASDRQYETVGHGKGRRRTVESVNDWAYNYGDSDDDMEYDSWQDESTFGWEPDRVEQVSPRKQLPATFLVEYGADRVLKWMLTSDTDFDSDYHTYKYAIVPHEYANKSDVEEFGKSKTREDVERVCRIVGARLIEYEDSTHFVIGYEDSVAYSTRKMRKSKHIYYDVELKKMKPRSFDSMVKSIKRRNAVRRKV